ncbi:MAG: hypothetical protein CM15mP106_4460 [Candidatus Neomarinimicrobiota bacterium]|nr:MAG: hypothetical protein CM15mP106_4460 [Candidatus Neomarinimicrobiota bacterium]
MKKIIEAEKERKALAGVRKLAKERAKKLIYTIENSEIAYHLNNEKNDRRLETTLFITEEILQVVLLPK